MWTNNGYPRGRYSPAARYRRNTRDFFPSATWCGTGSDLGYSLRPSFHPDLIVGIMKSPHPIGVTIRH